MEYEVSLCCVNVRANLLSLHSDTHRHNNIIHSNLEFSSVNMWFQQ
jgi:hypothetical protein